MNPGFVNFSDFTVSERIPGNTKTFDQLQPKISLTWDATDDTTVYGSWGVGFKAGGFNNLGANDIVNFFLVQNGGALVAPPDVIRKETSTRSNWASDRRFLMAICKSMARSSRLTSTTCSSSSSLLAPSACWRTAENIDEVSLSGFELSAAWAVTDNLRIDAGYSAVDGEIDVNNLRPYTAGNEVPNNPEFTANAAIQYTLPLGSLELFGRLEYSYKGDTWYHTVQDDVVPATLFGGPPANYGQTNGQGGTMVDGYGLTNIRVGLRGENWSVTAFARNLTDEEFVAEVILAPEFGGAFVAPGTQRRAGVEVSYRF